MAQLINGNEVKIRDLEIGPDGIFTFVLFEHDYERVMKHHDDKQLIELEYFNGLFLAHSICTVHKFYKKVSGVFDELL